MRSHRHSQGSKTPQVACYGTRTTAASEELVASSMADGRGARFGSGLTVAQGGCTEPRSVTKAPTCLPADNPSIHMDSLGLLLVALYLHDSPSGSPPAALVSSTDLDGMTCACNRHCTSTLAGIARRWRLNSSASLAAPTMCGWSLRVWNRMSCTLTAYPIPWSQKTRSSFSGRSQVSPVCICT